MNNAVPFTSDARSTVPAISVAIVTSDQQIGRIGHVALASVFMKQIRITATAATTARAGRACAATRAYVVDIRVAKTGSRCQTHGIIARRRRQVLAGRRRRLIG